jgi:hypothetical protein
MRSGLWRRRFAAGVGGVAILAMVGLSASCSQKEEAPSETTTTTTTTTTTSASVQPTEKAPRIEPGPNPFSPTVHAPPAPTAVPGHD